MAGPVCFYFDLNNPTVYHFPDGPTVCQGCLVRPTDFNYRETPIATFITDFTKSGYKLHGVGYLKQSIPPLEFEYSEAIVSQAVETIDLVSVENRPSRVDGSSYQLVDLVDGEGLSGFLSKQGAVLQAQ